MSKETKKNYRMFLDDNEYPFFFRRLSWSPDGMFLLTPSALHMQTLPNGDSKATYSVYCFLKDHLT